MMKRSPREGGSQAEADIIHTLQSAKQIPQRMISMLGKTRYQIQQHPVASLLWTAASLGSIWLCKYFACCLVAGLLIWCARQDSPASDSGAVSHSE